MVRKGSSVRVRWRALSVGAGSAAFTIRSRLRGRTQDEPRAEPQPRHGPCGSPRLQVGARPRQAPLGPRRSAWPASPPNDRAGPRRRSPTVPPRAAGTRRTHAGGTGADRPSTQRPGPRVRTPAAASCASRDRPILRHEDAGRPGPRQADQMRSATPGDLAPAAPRERLGGRLRTSVVGR